MIAIVPHLVIRVKHHNNYNAQEAGKQPKSMANMQVNSLKGQTPHALCQEPWALVEGLIPRKGGVMPAPRKYPNELRERAQRMVAESMSEDPSLTLNGEVKRIGLRVAGRRLRGEDAPGVLRDGRGHGRDVAAVGNHQRVVDRDRSLSDHRRDQCPDRSREYQHQTAETDRRGYRNAEHYKARILLRSAAQRAA